MKKAAFIEDLSQKVTKLIGYPLGVEHIHSLSEDGSGWHYYIRDLKPGYPVLAIHYRGPLMLALPFADYQQLETGAVTVDEYIAKSHWNYGHFRGGGSLIGGVYWQPLEKGKGIHDTELISRYLLHLSCLVSSRVSGYHPTPEGCAKCQLEAQTCPYSPLNHTGTWEKAVPMLDGRIELFDAVAKRVEDELGFEIYDRMSHREGREDILLLPGYDAYTVNIHLPQELLNDLLYHPHHKYDWKEMARRLNIILSSPEQPERRMTLDRNATSKYAICMEFWGDAMPRNDP